MTELSLPGGPTKFFTGLGAGNFGLLNLVLEEVVEFCKPVLGWSTFDDLAGRQTVAEQLGEAPRPR